MCPIRPRCQARACAAVVEAGRWLFLNPPNSDSLVARALGRHWVLLLREHLWYFSPTTIAALLARVGFRCEATQPNVVRFSLANVGVRLGQYPGRVPKSCRSDCQRFMEPSRQPAVSDRRDDSGGAKGSSRVPNASVPGRVWRPVMIPSSRSGWWRC